MHGFLISVATGIQFFIFAAGLDDMPWSSMGMGTIVCVGCFLVLKMQSAATDKASTNTEVRIDKIILTFQQTIDKIVSGFDKSFNELSDHLKELNNKIEMANRLSEYNSRRIESNANAIKDGQFKLENMQPKSATSFTLPPLDKQSNNS